MNAIARRRLRLQPRRVITLAIALLVLLMVGGSFYANVLRPHDSGGMKGMSSAGSGGPGSGSAAGTETNESAVRREVPFGPVPPTLAGIRLASVQDGDEARVRIEQLHGQPLGEGTDRAWIARYADAETTLWITRSDKRSDATSLYERMTAAIPRKGSPFTDPKPLKGVKGYELDGMGQKHFYFIVRRDVLWLAASPESADETFRELLAYVRQTDKRRGW